MIIKVRTTPNDCGNSSVDGKKQPIYWRVFGGVNRVAYGIETVYSVEKCDDVDYYELITESPCTTSEGQQALYLAFYDDDQPITIVTNHECYLMNDAGKTIEVLHD